MPCLSDDTLIAFADGELDEPALRGIEEHIDACDGCRALVAAWMNLDTRAVGSEPGSPDHAVSAELSPGTVVARYKILGPLGVGAMGIVYEAYDADLQRKVALKLLHPGLADTAQARARLVREARITAQIAHPNVVTVHEVGVAAGRVFIAMELIAGKSAREWLLDRDRAPHEIAAVFAAAGRGLAGAHRHGVVHRDFKPANVMIADDGQVKVMDFGLARGEIDDELADDTISSLSDLTATHTRTGAILGTPAYMSPEQFAGEPIGAAADQFSFCIAVWEALVGRRPFAGRTYAEVRAAVLAGRIADAGKGRIPRRLERALRRGLSRDPARRFGSIAALLAELTPVRSRRWPWSVAAAVGLTVVAAGALAWSRQGSATSGECEDGAAVFAQAWGDGQRRELRAAFTSGEAPGGAAALAPLERELDRYAGSWIAAHDALCEPDSTGRSTPAVVAARRDCLDQRRSEVRALVQVLREPTDDMIPVAAKAVRSLSSVSDCARADAQSAPALPSAQDTRAAVVALRARVDRISALHALGLYKDTLDEALATQRDARKLNHLPTLVRATYLAAMAQRGVGDFKATETLLRETIAIATRAGDQRTPAAAWVLLVWVVGYAQGNADAGLVAALAAEQAIEKANRDDLRPVLELNLGAIESARGRLPEAQRHVEAAVAAFDRLYGKNDVRSAMALSNLGAMLGDQGKQAEAQPYLRRAIALWQASGGSNNPDLVFARSALANSLRDQQRFDEAEVEYRESIRILRATRADHTDLPRLLSELAVSLRRAGKPAEAMPLLDEALAIARIHADRDPQGLLRAASIMGTALFSQGKPTEAEPYYREAASVSEKLYGVEHPRHGMNALNLAIVLMKLERWREAKLPAEQYVMSSEKQGPPARADLAQALMVLGDVLHNLGDRAAARAALERGIATCRTVECDAETAGGLDLATAQILIESGQRKRGRALAAGARQRYVAAGLTEHTAELDNWMKKHD